MNSQDFRNLQESYMAVYDNGIREKLEFESWVNNLLEEGYDLSDYTWDELYENYIQLDEAIYSEKGKAKAAEMIAKRSTPSGRAKSGKGANVAQIRQIRGSGRGRFDREGLGGTPMTPTMAKNPIKKQNYDGTGNKAARRAAALNKESYDLYDIILSHLLDEGYADTYESAERIMVNMSEEWRDSIIETRLDPRGRPASGPMNVYANPKKPSQAHLDAVKAYDAAQKKKTPEQKQKELDAYMNRKRYS
jgi:hypothetical protein